MELLELFYVFFKIGFFSIGGGYAIIPLIQEQVVDHFGWITQQMFTDIITISQMTPGPLAVNTSTFIGIRIGGIGGAVAATFGCVISGILISLGLYRFFKQHKESCYVFEVIRGLKASSLGLIISAAVTILLLAFTGSDKFSADMRFDYIAIIVFLGAFFALRKLKANPIFVMVITGVIGIFLY